MVRLRAVGASLSSAERRDAVGLLAAVAALHVVGFGLLGAGGLGLGLGLTAYTLGMRHAFDLDHIAAIDNTTRKLVGEGGRPLSVGFWFALGHSTVVFALVALLAVGVRGLGGAVADAGSPLQQVTGVIGPVVSGVFLLFIGLLNLWAFAGLVRMVRRVRAGALDAGQLDATLVPRGPLGRLTARAARVVRHPWQLFPLGVLFGLGFDTATEVALLATAGTAAAGGLPLGSVLSLPLLFAAGMTLLDTLDGVVMRVAYGWAFVRPAQRLTYNLTVTGLSVAAALAIGGMQLLSGVSWPLPTP